MLASLSTVLVLLLEAANQSPAPILPPPAPQPVPNVEGARQTLDREMRDWSTARFRNVAARQAGDGLVQFCGEVNATNAFGGHTGWQTFSLLPNYPLMPFSTGEMAGRLCTGERVDQTDYSSALTAN